MEPECGSDCLPEKNSLLEAKGKGEKIKWDGNFPEEISMESTEEDMIPIIISESILEKMIANWLEANATKILKECLQEPKTKKRKFFGNK